MYLEESTKPVEGCKRVLVVDRGHKSIRWTFKYVLEDHSHETNGALQTSYDGSSTSVDLKHRLILTVADSKQHL
jgi:hypothetical protein